MSKKRTGLKAAHLLICGLVFTQPLHAAEVEAFVALDHTSNLFRGAPFNDKEEFTADALVAGITITAGKRSAWEIDLTHGVQRIDNSTEPASNLSVRFYPGRLR
jgi:hypothetical protein